MRKKKQISVIIPFDTMKNNIKQGEKWVRSDWKYNDKYVIISDDRYVDKSVLLLVFRDSGDHIIFIPTHNDYKYNWRKLDA
jgi:hypothetical protein